MRCSWHDSGGGSEPKVVTVAFVSIIKALAMLQSAVIA